MESEVANGREFYAGAALGYRAWKLDGFRLLPVFKRWAPPWRPGANQAICAEPRSVHRAPDSSCGCGLQAYHEPRRMQGQIKLQRVLQQWPAKRSVFEVFGAVAGSGDLEIHYHGWRASEAQILGLWCPEPLRSPERIEQLEDAAAYYRVPLFESVEELVAHGQRFALPIPESRRPPKPDAIDDPEQFGRFLQRHRERMARRKRRSS